MTSGYTATTEYYGGACRYRNLENKEAKIPVTGPVVNMGNFVFVLAFEAQKPKVLSSSNHLLQQSAVEWIRIHLNYVIT